MKLRILLLADINSPHTQKWALGLASHSIEIGIFSFNHAQTNWYKDSPTITCLMQKPAAQSNRFFSKLAYLLLWPQLMIQIIKFRPNVLHAHYASSYGLLGALTFFKPFLVSAWGSDVTEFPKKGWLHRLILKFVFWRAHKICVTSASLQTQIGKLTHKPCLVIPFGVDLNAFYAENISEPEHPFTFGCVKHFEKIYNLDKLVLAFNLLVHKYPKSVLRLKLVGDGSEMPAIKKLVASCKLNSRVEFVGRVLHSDVPTYLHSIDVFVNVSEYESFGVAVAEAMACKVPVIVSNSEGFKDLVPDAEHAIITDSTSPEDIFKAMEAYYLNADRRTIAVQKSYALIREKFNWLDNLRQMEQVYFEFAPGV